MNKNRKHIIRNFIETSYRFQRKHDRFCWIIDDVEFMEIKRCLNQQQLWLQQPNQYNTQTKRWWSKIRRYVHHESSQLKNMIQATDWHGNKKTWSKFITRSFFSFSEWVRDQFTYISIDCRFFLGFSKSPSVNAVASSSEFNI